LHQMYSSPTLWSFSLGFLVHTHTIQASTASLHSSQHNYRSCSICSTSTSHCIIFRSFCHCHILQELLLQCIKCRYSLKILLSFS
jgi:hypothetical protein